MNSKALEWQRIKAIFQTLAERPEAEWEASLRAMAPEDSAVAGEVRALLEAHREGGGAVATALLRESGMLDAGVPVRERAGQRIGPYSLLRSLGEGGMGEVWLAERADDAFHKQVAVKLVRSGLIARDAFGRFRTEREALARLEHPNIVRLLDGGTDEEGTPYFVMEYVDGEPIERYCEERLSPLRERLRLFAQVCAAVEEAHRNLIVHRDIKPGNVLVTPDGTVKLLDFGIAKLLDPESGSNLLTRTAITPATPAFASPEQLAGGPVTTATDVYALGILLYRLIAGRHPYALDSEQLAEVARVIRDTMPSRPSLAVAAEVPGSPADTRLPLPSDAARRAWSRELRGDLDNIALTALRKEPARRYGSAALLAQDVERYLGGLPISATPDSLRYRTGLFLRRHPFGVTAASAAVVGLLAVSAFAFWEAKRAAREALLARSEQAKAEAVSQFMTGVLGSADTSAALRGLKAGSEVTVADVLVDAGARAGKQFGSQPDVEAKVRTAIGSSDISLGRYAEGLEQLGIAVDKGLAGHPEPNIDRVEALHTFARAQYVVGQLKESELTYRRVLSEYGRLGKLSAESQAGPMVARHDLALVLFEGGRFPEAEEIERQASTDLRATLGESSPIYWIMLSLLGRVRASRGDMVESEKLCRQAITLFDGVPAFHGSAERGRALYHLCRVLDLSGRSAEAEPVCEEARAVMLNALGPRHPYGALALVALGDLAHERGRDDRAEDLIRQGLGVQRDRLPAGHYEFTSTNTALGRVLAARGQASEGEALLREALASRRRLFPAGDWRTALTASLLGEVLAREGKGAEAQPLLRGGYEAMRSALGEKHPQTVLANRRLELGAPRAAAP